MQRHELQTKLGHTFSSHALLEQALTHRSFGIPHNERLEFLGDSVLNCLVAKRLFDRFPALPEGDLSRLRANLVNQSTLAAIASHLLLSDELRMGEGEQKSGGAFRASILADALEALVGAVYLDAGFDAAGAVVNRLFESQIDLAQISGAQKDPKTMLQEWLQKEKKPLPQYDVVRIEGAAHRQTFHVVCTIPAYHIRTEGEGVTRRIAEQSAATKAFVLITATQPVSAK